MSENTENPEMQPGVIGWSEVNTSDKDACVKFYSSLFGWSTEEMELPDGTIYTMFKQGEKPVAGCAASVPDEASNPPMWMNYINVEDIDVSLAKARELGAQIDTPRVDLPMGSFVILSDPQGATFAFWQNNADSSC